MAAVIAATTPTRKIGRPMMKPNKEDQERSEGTERSRGVFLRLDFLNDLRTLFRSHRDTALLHVMNHTDVGHG